MAQLAHRSTHISGIPASTSAERGFTIVELLVVIVVIAILAAISIVAYNGIQNRARTASVSAALNQASKKLALYAADNSGSYPATSAAFFTEVGADSSGKKADVEFQYAVNNSIDPKTFCVTGTAGNVSMKVSQAGGAPTSGGCAGHGQGGSAALTNLATNPGAESNSNGTQSVGSNTASISRVTDTKRSGVGAFRAVANGASAGFTHVVSVQPGSTFRYSAYLFSTSTVQTSMYGQTSVNGTYAGIPVQSGNTGVTIPANSWTRVSWTGTHPAGAASASLGFLILGGSGTTVYVDDVIVTEGTNDISYADGDSPNWIWNGTPNNSTSTGPAP